MDNNFEQILKFAINSIFTSTNLNLNEKDFLFYENILDTALDIPNLSDVEIKYIQLLLSALNLIPNKTLKFSLLEKELTYKIIRKSDINQIQLNCNNEDKIKNKKPIKDVYKKIIKEGNAPSKVKIITEYEDGTFEEIIESGISLIEDQDILTYENIYNMFGTELLIDIQNKKNNESTESEKQNEIYRLD